MDVGSRSQRNQIHKIDACIDSQCSIEAMRYFKYTEDELGG